MIYLVVRMILAFIGACTGRKYLPEMVGDAVEMQMAFTQCMNLFALGVLVCSKSSRLETIIFGFIVAQNVSI